MSIFEKIIWCVIGIVGAAFCVLLGLMLTVYATIEVPIPIYVGIWTVFGGGALIFLSVGIGSLVEK